MKISTVRKLIAGGLAAAALAAWASGQSAQSQVNEKTPARIARPVLAPPNAAATYPSSTITYAPQAGAGGPYAFFAGTSEQAQTAAAHEQKARELLSKYSATENQEERAKLVEQLSSVVSEQFEARQQARQQELERLEEQLKKLRQLHDRRASEKSQIVEDRVRQLLREADGLGWGAEEQQHRNFYVAPVTGFGAVPGVPGTPAVPAVRAIEVNPSVAP